MTFEQWRASLTAEQSYDFDSEGRGYPKDRNKLMRLAWEYATKAAREECAMVCDEEGAEWDSDDVVPEKNYAAHCAKRIRAL